MAKQREEILKIENLKHYFTSGRGKNKIVVKAVDDISFSVYKGEVFSLVGESGCGKTTTGRALINLYKATGGDVYFHGHRIITDYKKAKKMFKEGLITQEELLQAKYDRNYDKVVTPEMKTHARAINPTHEDVIEFTKPLLDENDKLQKDILTLEDSNEISNAKKKIKLNTRKISKIVKDKKRSILRERKDLMRKMQMIFQDPIASLNPRMTVKEIIAEGLRINGVNNEVEIDKRVKEALTIVGLVPEHAGRYPHEFSGGQRQRIGIARALVANPSFIIADEPISALDVSIRAQVINLLNDLRRDYGVTILFIAHDLSVVKYFSDRVAVMYFGKIVEMGKKELIFENTLHPYTQSLIESIPLPDPIYEKNRSSRKRYNPMTAHDYSVEKPELREVEPDHFVLCNTKEFEEYQAIIKKNKAGKTK